MQQQSYALSAWYSRELREAAEVSDRVAQAPAADKDALPALSPLQANVADAKVLSAVVTKIRDRRAFLLGGSLQPEAEPAAQEMTARLSSSQLPVARVPQELLRWDTDFLALSESKMVGPPLLRPNCWQSPAQSMSPLQLPSLLLAT